MTATVPLMVAALLHVAAQSSGRITGVVRDGVLGRPLAGVSVTLESGGGGTTTDSSGRFALAGVAPGVRVLRVSLVGYGLARRDVTVRQGATTPVDIALAPGTLPYVEKVTVRGDPFGGTTPGAAAGFSLGTGDVLALRGVLADDPMRAAQSIPGVASTDDFSAEFDVRGQGPRHLDVSLDGIDSPLLVHSVRGGGDTGSLALFNSDVLAGIDLEAGARPQTGAARLGASLDFRLRDGARDRFSWHGAVSGTSASAVFEGPLGSSRRASWLASFRRSYLDWLIRRIDPESDSTLGFTDAVARATWDPSTRHHLTFTWLGGRTTVHEGGENPGPSSLDHAVSRTNIAKADWRWTPSGTLLVSQRVYTVRAAYNNVVPNGEMREGGNDRDVTYRAEATWARWAAVTIGAGARAETTRGYRFERGSTSELPEDPIDASAGDRSVSGWIGGRWRPVPAFDIRAGSRVDHWRESGATAGSPWLLGDVRLTPGTSLRAGVAVSHQGPDLDELVIGGQRLVPESAWTADVGLEQRFVGVWRARATLYVRRASNLIDRQLLPRIEGEVVHVGSPSVVNKLQERAGGLEVLLQRRSVAGLSGWVAYTYGRVREEDPVRGESFDGDADRRHTVSAYATYRAGPRTNLSLRWRGGTNTPLAGYYDQVGSTDYLATGRNGARLPGYSRLDVRADRTFDFTRRRVTLFAEVLNVLNRSNYALSDPSISIRTGVVRGLTEKLFPVLPSIGLMVEF